VLTWSDGGALLAVFLWGANFPILKRIMAVLGPMPVMFVRGAISSLLLVGLLRLAGQWRLPPRGDLPALLTFSAVGFTLNQVFYAVGLHLTTASHSGLIFTFTPLMVYGLAHLLGQLRIAGPDVVGLGLGVGGAILILGAPWAAPAGGATLGGDLLTVGSAATWAMWTIVSVPLLHRHGSLLVTAWFTGAGSLGLLPLALPGLVTAEWTAVPWTVYLGLLYAATAAGALGSLLWYAAVRQLGPARTAIYANLESFFAVVSAAVFLGERVEWTAILGGVCVVGGVLLTRRSGRRPAAAAAG
jgi:drug/metabolite transporter (DMT)-like permease